MPGRKNPLRSPGGFRIYPGHALHGCRRALRTPLRLHAGEHSGLTVDPTGGRSLLGWQRLPILGLMGRHTCGTLRCPRDLPAERRRP